MPLYKHQTEFLARNPNKTSLVWSCGLGKSRAALEWAMKDERALSYSEFPLLIICPKALKANWIKEYIKADCPFTPKIMTKEEFKKAWLEKKMIPYKQVIVDEVHIGFLTPNWKSDMSKALRDYLKKYGIERVLLCSATVYTSSPWNIYNLAFLTGNKWDWKKFRIKFFDDVWMGPRIIPQAKKGCEKELAVLTKRIADVVNIADVIDVPLQHHAEPEYFALTKEQKKAIDLAYDPLPIVRYTRQHEIENGIHYEGEGIVNNFSSDKIERLKAIAEENPKMAIVCRYTAQITLLEAALAEYKPMIIRGDVEDRVGVCDAAEKADKAVVIIQADCGVGFELPSFPLCVYVSMSYSYTSWEQMNGRFLRVNKPSRTTFMYLLTEGDSVDQGVYDAVKRKEDFKIELFKKNK